MASRAIALRTVPLILILGLAEIAELPAPEDRSNSIAIGTLSFRAAPRRLLRKGGLVFAVRPMTTGRSPPSLPGPFLVMTTEAILRFYLFFTWAILVRRADLV